MYLAALELGKNQILHNNDGLSVVGRGVAPLMDIFELDLNYNFWVDTGADFRANQDVFARLDQYPNSNETDLSGGNHAASSVLFDSGAADYIYIPYRDPSIF